VIRDLGVPAGLQDPMPFAINHRGDVALQYCPAGGCVNSPTGIWYPYFYDGLKRRLFALDRLNQFPGERYYPWALNDHGQIVGTLQWISNTSGGVLPVMWTRMSPNHFVISLLDPRPGFQGDANAINERGDIVGDDGPTGETLAAVRFTNSGPVPLTQSSLLGAGLGIDYHGLAVGQLDGDPIIFSGPNGTAVPDVGPIGQIEYAASVAINHMGNVIGDYDGQNVNGKEAEEGFLYTAATQTSLSYTYGDYTYISALNNRNDLVGVVEQFGPYPNLPNGPFVTGPDFPAFLLADLLPANAKLSPNSATGINDCGQIVGQADSSAGTRAYILEPHNPPFCAAR
jgi:hypothetical protein